jgi:ACS family tartrate transporter-like MFS transporter
MNVGDIERRTMRLVSRRLLPFLFILYIFAFLDRSNISIAALQMNDELKFGPAVFGLGAGIFYLGYSFLEVPSNLILARVGARLWIARIMITWGILASAMIWVRTPLEFYSARLLLGMAEAGFFPGIIYYLTQWFPMAYRARATARFALAVPLSQAIGGALGGALLSLGGVGQLSGWQWLFLIEGLPAVFLGVGVLFYLTDRPEDARWLDGRERGWLAKRIEEDRHQSPTTLTVTPLQAIGSPLTWALAFPNFAFYTVGAAYFVWAPLLIRGALGTRDVTTGLVYAGIAVLSAAAYLIAAARSDQSAERCGYAAFGLALSSLGCVGAAIAPTSGLRVAALALIPIGSAVFQPAFWCLPAMLFSGTAAAASIALISAVGATGGFFGPGLLGFVKRATGGDNGAFLMLAGIGTVGCLVCIGLRQTARFTRRSASSTSELNVEEP